MSLVLVAASSLAGALVFPLSDLGRAAPASVSREWLLLLALVGGILGGWAFLYTLLLRRLAGFPTERALYYAALCHTPLLLCLSLLPVLYGSDIYNHVYSRSPYGQVIFQPLAKGYVFAAPVLAQALLLAALRWRAVVAVLPIVAITLVALGLRLWNLNWGLPALYHWDEHHYIGRALRMIQTGDLNPHYFENPSLIIYLDYLLDRILSPYIQPFHLMADFFGLGILDPRGDYLLDLAARGVSAAAGALTVVAVYLAGRELFGRGVAIFSASLLAVSFLHVKDSHYATNDVVATFFLAVSFVFSARILSRGRPADYLLAGLFGGLASATKYNTAFFFVAIVAAHLARTRAGSGEARFPQPHILVVAGGLVSLGAFLVGTPYALLDFPTFASDFREQYGFGALVWQGQDDAPSVLQFLHAIARGFGLIPLVLAALALPVAAPRDRWALAIVVSVPMVYLLFMFTQRLFFARFAIPTLPFLSLLAGYAIQQLGSSVRGPSRKSLRRGAGVYPQPARGRGGGQVPARVQRPSVVLPATGDKPLLYSKNLLDVPLSRPLPQTVLCMLLLATALVQPLALSFQHNALLGQEDTRALAAAWVEANVPPDTAIAAEVHSRLHSPFAWKASRLPNTSVFEPASPDDAAEVLSGRFGYVVVGSFGYGLWLRDRGDASTLPSLYNALDQEGQLVAVFHPGFGGEEVPYANDDVYTPFWHLADRERPGPTIKIYKMQPAKP